MSEKIKPTTSGNVPASFYNTLVPSLDDNANIQQALRMYHYGTADGTVPDDSLNPIASESIAAYLGSLQAQITAFDVGSEYSSTEPVDPEDGFIWVDADSAAPIFGSPPATIPSVAKYQDDAPITGLVDGMIWVDKNSSPLKMYVYDLTTTTWREIGA
jgi:hypothetical protein